MKIPHAEDRLNNDDPGTTQVIECDIPSSNVDLPNVAVVVPCYNERSAVPYLTAALAALQEVLAGKYEIEFVLVDDGSVDDTHRALADAFDHLPNYTVISHETNRGIAAAIMTGFRSATAEIVCSMDSDCTYDPKHLAEMIPVLTADVDVVTASPYHPQGAVKNASGQDASGWRIWLSRSASRIYQRMFRHDLYCYTCCFRVYRRRAVADINLAFSGFVGVTEMLWKLDRTGSRIEEVPAVLRPRTIGVSKMRVARTMVGHFKLISRILVSRIGDGVRGRSRGAGCAPSERWSLKDAAYPAEMASVRSGAYHTKETTL